MAKKKRKRKTCVIGARCRKHYDQVHGLEAEELRKGVEELITHAGEDSDASDDQLVVRAKDLQRLLDKTDARDSLAYIESQE